MWDLISAAKDLFPVLRMVQVASAELTKMSKQGEGGSLFCSTPLYIGRITNFSCGIVKNRRVVSNMALVA